MITMKFFNRLYGFFFMSFSKVLSISMKESRVVDQPLDKETWRQRSKIQYVPDWACLPKDHDWYKQ